MNGRLALVGVGGMLLVLGGCKTKVPAQYADLAELVEQTGGKVEMQGTVMFVDYKDSMGATYVFPKYEAALKSKGWAEKDCPTVTSCDFTKDGKTLYVNAGEDGKDVHVTVHLE